MKESITIKFSSVNKLIIIIINHFIFTSNFIYSLIWSSGYLTNYYEISYNISLQYTQWHNFYQKFLHCSQSLNTYVKKWEINLILLKFSICFFLVAKSFSVTRMATDHFSCRSYFNRSLLNALTRFNKILCGVSILHVCTHTHPVSQLILLCGSWKFIYQNVFQNMLHFSRRIIALWTFNKTEENFNFFN